MSNLLAISPFECNLITKIIFACILGGFIGFSREKEGKAAGLRTHILVCIGATIFTMLSFMAFSMFPNVDPTRIASNVLIGIGFIGAGTIIRNAGGSISGITTAASIWIAAAIGMSISFELYHVAIFTTALPLIVLHSLHRLEKKYIHDKDKPLN